MGTSCWNSQQEVNIEFTPSSTKTELEGNILSVLTGISKLGGVAQIGQYQVVVLNIGESSGVEPGNVFGIYQSNLEVTDTIGPNQPKNIVEEDEKRIKFEREDTHFVDRELSKLVNAIRGGFNKFDNRFPEFANRKSKSEIVSLPEEYVGNMMVFRTFDKISYALVMELTGPVHVSDTVRSL